MTVGAPRRSPVLCSACLADDLERLGTATGRLLDRLDLRTATERAVDERLYDPRPWARYAAEAFGGRQAP